MSDADLPRLPPRHRDSSKRDYGRVVVVGGSAGMAGAAALSAMAAVRSGAGLVEALVPACVAGIAAGFDPCVMTHGLPDTSEGGFAAAAAAPILARTRSADALAVGPGLGRGPPIGDLVARLWRESEAPGVFDADALFALGAGGTSAPHAGPRIVTPHAGELLRLLGLEPADPRARDRGWLEARAAEIAAEGDVTVVLKGPATLVVDGRDSHHNDTGNPGMAKGGSGDVLTGVVAALLAQGLAAGAAARLAVWVHGRAGDAAAADLGEVSMTPRDLLDRLHVGFRAAASPRPGG
jgi:hydroxyethylthiazole kinase-like uncharacterized protein yjeF